MKSIAIIPARSGSKRIPNKNIRNLGGIPLLVWSILVAKAVKGISNVYVSTDSPEYREIARAWECDSIARPSELCTDDATGENVLRHAITNIESCDLIVQLLPTTPFRTPEMVEKAIQTMLEAGENADSLRSVEEMEESAYKCFVLHYGYLTPMATQNYKLEPNNASFEFANAPNQKHTKTYRGNGYVDIVKTSRIDNDFWGSRCIGFITKPVIEIDTEDQFRYAEWWIKNHWTREEIKFVRK